ncbi:S1 RNA-binding domain-containing protein [Catenulispora sp. NF23]|uniref:S1 RNA-binding domain-containing protein n=1 Tax=Catenulispora pinistramenti TaxID=2705254 RepID=A0ABS5L7E5_9ACTN|nr:S1 RNA-binding domain-containing protein [Catenulispora pinistramenti]MBS2534619.1 S1 RNA-binding domain-containing protein [Catenulispora pinistramenti]MBS2554283.1 S1 RNA-binding domain-containing protein [Catenulispora pinistramenti]
MPEQDDFHAEWNAFAADHASGDLVAGSITKVAPFGAFIRLGGRVEGLLHRTHLDHTPEVGDRLTVRIDEIDARRQRLVLSAG